MTCIVGAVDKGVVYMGGDSCVSWPNVVISGETTKVFQRGEVLLGVCGSCKVGDILCYLMPELPDTLEDPGLYLRTDFMPNVFNALKKWSWNNDEEHDFEFLFGFKGHLYVFNSDFSILAAPKFGFAIGSGGEVALGSMATTFKMEIPVRERLALALKAAELVVPTVRSPFKIWPEVEPVKTKRKKKPLV